MRVDEVIATRLSDGVIVPCNEGFGQWLLRMALPPALEAIEGGGSVEGSDPCCR